jgi:protein TonB
MAYADQKQNKAVALGSALVIQGAIGAALLTGLVVTTTTPDKDPPIDVIFEPLPPAPPPPPEPAKEMLPKTSVSPPITVPVPPVRVPNEVSITTTTETFPPTPPTPTVRVEPTPPMTAPPTPPAVNLSRGVAPRGNQGDWFPQDSYPAAAQRAGAEGRVSVSVGVGANGRVTDCRVTESSGDASLDEATCRLAKRNGRFEPARDASGNAVASTTSLRGVRWQLTD